MMYTSTVETRSNRPRALVTNTSSLPRIYHYETFAGTRDTRVDEPKKPRTSATPTSVKKVKTLGKAVHRLTTYLDVATHYKVSEFLGRRNIGITDGPRFLYFLMSLLLMFLLCTSYMAATSKDYKPTSSLSTYLTNLFSSSSHNFTLDHLREEAKRQYDELTKDKHKDDTSSSSSSSSSSPYPSSSHPSSSNRVHEENLEKYVKEDLARLENRLKRMSEEQAKKLDDLSRTVDQKTKTLEDQQKRYASDSNDAWTSIGRAESAFADSKKELTSQIERLQAELAKVGNKQPVGGGDTNQKGLSDLTSMVEKLQKQKDSDDAEKQGVITGLQSQVQHLQAELSRMKSVDNSKEIEELREKIQRLEKELAEQKRTKPAAGPELTALKTEIAKGVHALIQADTTGRVDYALLNLGARIVTERTSPSYSRVSDGMFSSWWPMQHYFKHPSVILTQEVTPGECWSMQGSYGHVTVKLAEPVVPGAVSIDHISPLVSPDISSALREFSVLGLKNVADAGTLLGTFMFDLSAAETIQTFELKNNQETYPLVMLSILSNHGNDNYTCIYRFRVHPHNKQKDM